MAEKNQNLPVLCPPGRPYKMILVVIEHVHNAAITDSLLRKISFASDFTAFAVADFPGGNSYNL
jgi:hypothetical protein